MGLLINLLINHLLLIKFEPHNIPVHLPFATSLTYDRFATGLLWSWLCENQFLSDLDFCGFSESLLPSHKDLRDSSKILILQARD
jgi:hypothetical protein